MATLTKDYQIIGTSETVYFGSCYAYITLHGKYNSQSVTNNTSTYEITANLNVFNGYIGNYQSTPYSISSTGLTTKSGDLGQGNFSTRTIDGILGTVTHNSDGTKSITASASINFTAWGKAITVTATADLPKIPREFTKTPTITLIDTTETTMNYNWSTSENCSSITWNGEGIATFTGINGRNGTITITGLNANSSYSHYGTFKRSDSGLTTNSNVITNSTYDYPYCTEGANFTIGNNATIKFYNPLNRTIQIQLWSHASQQFVSDLITISGTSYTGFSNLKEKLYSSIPNATSSMYNVDVHYSGNKNVKNAGTYYIDVNDCKPIFNDFNYSTNYSELTGNNNTIIDGKTNTTISIPSNKKAIGKYSASIKRYHFEIGSITNDINYSNNEITTILNNCKSNVIRITAIDSRGIETTVTKTVENYKNYTPPVLSNVNIERENGVDKKTILNLDIIFWNSNFGIKNNKIEFLKYRTKISNSSEWNEWNNINTNLLEINNDVARLNDYLIHYDGISGGFEIGVKYDIQFRIEDGNETILSDEIKSGYTVTDGSVAFSILKDSYGIYHIGINGMPDLNVTLKVHGNISEEE